MFQTKIALSVWHIDESDVNTSFDRFYEAIQVFFNESFPETILSIKKHKMKPWLDNDLLKQIRKKNMLYKKWLTSKAYSDKLVYLHLKNVVEGLIQKAKKEYFHKSFSRNCNNIKNTWKYIKEALGSNSRVHEIHHMVYQNQKFKDPHDIANVFNDFFCSVAKNLSKALPSKPFKYSGNTSSHSFLLSPTDESEVIRTVMEMKNNHSLGCFGKFSIRHIKWIISYIESPLATIFNLCIKNGIFPDTLKISKVTPVHKASS